MPAWSRPKAFWRLSSVLARSANWTWSLRAVSGVLSSCAASEANRFCASRLCSNLANKSFKAKTNCLTSTGSPLTGNGSSDVDERVETILAVRLRLAKPCPTNSHTATTKKGSSKTKGCKMWSAEVKANFTRTSTGWAVIMEILWTVFKAKIRQVCPSWRMLAKPSISVTGNGEGRPLDKCVWPETVSKSWMTICCSSEPDGLTSGSVPSVCALKDRAICCSSVSRKRSTSPRAEINVM